MPELKIKVEIHKGRTGVPLERLARIADETRKFLDMLAKDVDLGTGEWIADRFTNNSVGYDTNFIGETTNMALAVAHKALRHITDPDRTPDDLGFGISRETFFQFGKIASSLPLDDVMFIGLYNGEPEPEMRPLTKARFLEIERLIIERTSHYGGVQGFITALFKGNNTIWVHDVSTRAKIVCQFAPSDYNKIWELLKLKDTVVAVEGWITKHPGRDNHLKIETIAPSVEYQEGDLERFFGIDPHFTADMSTEAYLDELRGETIDEYLKRLPDE